MTDQDKIFKAIADSTRRQIIHELTLKTDGMTINALSSHFDTTRQGVTKHLKILESAGLVKIEKEGRERKCVPQLHDLQVIYNWLMLYDQFWTDKLDNLEQFLKKKKR